MKKIRRIGAILLICILTFSMTTVAFAADTENDREVVRTSQTKGSTLLYGKSAYLSDGNGSFYFTVDEAENNVSIIAFVSGNSNMQYGITIKTPQGSSWNIGTVYGNGQTIQLNRASLPAGKYQVLVNAFGNSGPVNVLVQVYK